MRFSTVVWLLWLAALLGALPARAQLTLTLSGQVRDARTQQPLAFASVFLANTTYGTTTDSTGNFTLRGIPGGQYDFMASYLGHELYKKTLDLKQATTLIANVQPEAVSLNEVVVRPNKNRPADFEKFTHLFLGNSALSRQCRIENPQDVLVFYDKNRRELGAVSPHNLRVLNQALGYRITYHNFDFKVFYNSNRCAFVAAPHFEELKSTDAKQQHRWEENRRKAYTGSLPHFLRSVRENCVEQQGFVVRAIVSEPNSEQAQKRAAIAGDSLAEITIPEPGILARVYKQPLSAEQIRQLDGASGRVKLRFPDAVQVTYQNEQPDAMYTAYMTQLRSSMQVEALASKWEASNSKTSLGKQLPYAQVLEVSELHLLGAEALILPNGYLSNPLSLKVDGYWGFEKVGESLPLDYLPALVK